MSAEQLRAEVKATRHMPLTWGEPEWLDEADPLLEQLAALDRINDIFVIVTSSDKR